MSSALQDVGPGRTSQIFKALFKDSSSRSFVQQILTEVATQRIIYGLQPRPFTPTPPNFACVTPSTKKDYNFLPYDPYPYCLRPGGPAAFYMGKTSYIFLCPAIWTVPPAPSLPDCPLVRRNYWVGPGMLLSRYMGYILIHEMIHFYLGERSLGLFTYPRETYDINQCVTLTAQDSLGNPQNYQNYIACGW